MELNIILIFDGGSSHKSSFLLEFIGKVAALAQLDCQLMFNPLINFALVSTSSIMAVCLIPRNQDQNVQFVAKSHTVLTTNIAVMHVR